MRAFIVEDEEPASTRLAKIITEIDPAMQVAGVAVSIQSAVDWLRTHERPDLIFMDIQLADGISFDIFNEVEVASPVIFTTAYDAYALQAFKVYSIDYLLKPIKKSELEAALRKFSALAETQAHPGIGQLREEIRKATAGYQRRIVIRYRDLIKVVDMEDAAYFYSADKVNFVCTRDDRRYPVDYTLEELEGLLDPKRFFRVNRQVIVSIDAIGKMVAYPKARIKIDLVPPAGMEVVASTERSPAFREWLLGR